METKISKKIKRFLELSNQFCEVPKVVKNLPINLTSFNGVIGNIAMGYTSANTINTGSTMEVPKNSQIIQNNADRDKLIADEWDEFLTLKFELVTYFIALDNITK